MSEQKTTLPFLRNEDWKKIKEQSEKVNKLLQYIPTDNITKLNELIYAGANLVNNKIGISLMNPKGNTKSG